MSPHHHKPSSPGDTVIMVKNILTWIFFSLFIHLAVQNPARLGSYGNEFLSGAPIRSHYVAGYNDCICDGTEDRMNGGKGPRQFYVYCTQKGDTQEFRKGRVFKGNPHDCAAYNNNGQQKFYDQLLGQIGPVVCDRNVAANANFGIECNPPDDTPYVTKLCPNLLDRNDFKLEFCCGKSILYLRGRT